MIAILAYVVQEAATGYPTMASIPHSIGNAYKVLVSIAVECEDYSFKKADEYKALL